MHPPHHPAMALRGLLLAALLAAPVAGAQQASFLGTEMQKCGPQTKIELSTAADAAGTSLFTPVEGLVDGTCVSQASSTVTAVKFCGPGTLTLSRMSCDKHDYKAKSVEHSAKEVTTGCETIELKGTVVEGYLGSFTVKC